MSSFVDDVARDVIRGVYGNGEARKHALAARGYDYNIIQARVNEMLKEPSMPKTGVSGLDNIAKEVIAGKWGNGQERINRLQAAGYDASAIQRRVNELLKG